MLSVTGKKVAIVPIYDPEVTAGWHRLSVEELKNAEARGIANENNQDNRIIIPEQAKERTDQGIVKYVGPKVKNLKPGDYVFYPNYAGTLMQIEDEGTVIIVPEDFVTCLYHVDDEVTVPGLFFKSKISYTHNQTTNAYRDEYMPATYEIAANLLATTFTEFKKTLALRDVSSLTPEQLDQLTAGAGIDDSIDVDEWIRTLDPAKDRDKIHYLKLTKLLRMSTMQLMEQE